MAVPSIANALNDAGIREETTQYLTEIINKLLEAQAAVAEAKTITSNLSRLPRCCGSSHMDSKGYYYANHGVADKCPLHGQHKVSGRRLRLYIGAKPEAVQTLHEAISNNAEWQRAVGDQKRKEARLNRLITAIKEAHAEAKNLNRYA